MLTLMCFILKFQSTGLNWATAANSMSQSGAQKSLAEIQAEEQSQERDRQERERREKKARQKGKYGIDSMTSARAPMWDMQEGSGRY